MAPGLNLEALANEVNTSHTLTQKSLRTSQPNASISSGTEVLDPSLVTTEFDLLRFKAAAYTQLQTSTDPRDGSTSPPLSSLLISSPYNTSGHYLDLETLDTGSLIFAKALTALKPTRPDYATAPYTEALNFEDVLGLVREFAAKEGVQWKKQTFYTVTFHSKLNETIDADLLYKLDSESHREACESGFLLKYWFGSVNGERRNLATCFWRTREDARKGGLGPWHKKARAAGRELYEFIQFGTHAFTILDGAESFTFEDWADR